jgi:uncharacterized phiE125 gp8 family phage protein
MRDRVTHTADITREVRSVTAPDYLPIAVATVEADHLRVASTGGEETTYVTGLIKTATRLAEKHTGRDLQLQRRELLLAGFPAGPIRLPHPPVRAIVSIVYLDDDGVEQTLATSAYALRSNGRDVNREGWVEPVYGTTWPTARPHLGAVTVTYDTGYSDGASPEAAAIPDDILHGILLVIGELYKQRSESVHAFNQNPALIRARQLWDGYRIY